MNEEPSPNRTRGTRGGGGGVKLRLEFVLLVYEASYIYSAPASQERYHMAFHRLMYWYIPQIMDIFCELQVEFVFRYRSQVEFGSRLREQVSPHPAFEVALAVFYSTIHCQLSSD